MEFLATWRFPPPTKGPRLTDRQGSSDLEGLRQYVDPLGVQPRIKGRPRETVRHIFDGAEKKTQDTKIVEQHKKAFCVEGVHD